MCHGQLECCSTAMLNTGRSFIRRQSRHVREFIKNLLADHLEAKPQISQHADYHWAHGGLSRYECTDRTIEATQLLWRGGAILRLRRCRGPWLSSSSAVQSSMHVCYPIQCVQKMCGSVHVHEAPACNSNVRNVPRTSPQSLLS